MHLPSTAVIDHWVNYATRFEREGDVVLPDELWVADSDALKIALQTFPDAKVLQIPNRYLLRQVSEIAQLPAPDTNRVLYVLEPVRFAWPGCIQAGEFEALDYFVENMGKLMDPRKAKLKLRLHPSDPAKKYDAWIKKHTELAAALDSSPTLSRAIGKAQWVAGCETTALVIALAAGRKTVSTLPPGAPRCRLPQAGLIHLADIR